jgi:imidazolonepropionase-like amidohydrolase
VIDGTGRVPISDGVVLIRDGRIAAVGVRGQVAIPPEALIIDGRGKYVIPGLMDANVHLVMRRNRVDVINRFEDLIEEAAQTALMYGQTTVFDTWGILEPLIRVRDRIRRGETEGSRIFVAGNCIGMAGPFVPGSPQEKEAGREAAAEVNRLSQLNTGPDLRFMTSDQVRTIIREYIHRGPDFLKYAASGHEEPDLIVFSEDVQRVIVDEGHRAGLTVQAHTTSNESLLMAVRAGVDLITHADVTGPVPIPVSTLALLKEKQIPCGFFPKTGRRWDIEIGGGSRTPGAKSRLTLESQRRNQEEMIKADIPLLINTDGGLWPPDLLALHPAEHWTDYEAIIGEGYFVRCRGMAEMGIPPMEIILAGTRNVARAYGLLDDLGTLEKGKLADLVILEADPLADIENLRRIAAVIKDGRVVERQRLPLKRIFYPGFRKVGS